MKLPGSSGCFFIEVFGVGFVVESYAPNLFLGLGREFLIELLLQGFLQEVPVDKEL